MNNLSPYKDMALIHTNNGIVVYKAFDEKRQEYVAYKTLDPRNVFSDVEELLEKEYENLKVFNSDRVASVLAFERGKAMGLITKFVAGDLLSDLIEGHGLTIDEKVKVAIGIIEALRVVHHKKMIHKDINPSNIIWDSNKGLAVLIDFNLAEKSGVSRVEFVQAKHLQGTVAYISPEQTGRMNRFLDYRSDYYSLGVTLYELFVEKLPFEDRDYLALVHAHIAEVPQCPSGVDPSIPQAISKMIMKLMEKNAQDRYQSLEGLLVDFQTFLTHQNPTMPIGTSDTYTQLNISQEVYGRQGEVEALHDIYEGVVRGAKKVVFVKGYSGVGKTTVVKELYKTITHAKGYFLSGKFDQYNTSIPYSAVRSIIVDFINLLLQEEEKKIQVWRQNLLDQLSHGASVLLSVIPELELVLGKDPVEATDIQENHNRFKRSMQKLMESIATPAHPVVLFLDDIQWIDTTSLSLLEEIIRNDDLKYLCIIGAYRDNEVIKNQTLSAFFNGLTRDDRDISFMEIGPLKREDVSQLIRDTFKGDIEDDLVLEVLSHKTQGNPFYIKQLMQWMYDKACIVYRDQRWRVDTTCLKQIEVGANVADVLSQSMQTLDSRSKQVLAIAACLGHSFDYDILKGVSHLEDKVLAEALSNLRTGHYIQALTTKAYVFSHDQIHQVAYGLMEDTYQTHLSIAKVMKAMTPCEEMTLTIAKHLAKCLDMKPVTDMDDLVDILCEAGDISLKNIAYSEAMIFYSLVETLEKRHDMAYTWQVNLKNQMIRTTYLLGDYPRFDSLCEDLKAYVQSPLHLAEMYGLKIHASMSLTLYQEGLDLALEALNLFGMNISLQVDEKTYEVAMEELFHVIGQRPIEALIDLPLMEDEDQEHIMKMLTGLIPLLFNTAPQLLLLVIIKMLRISLDYGQCKYSAFAYGFFATILSGMGKIEESIAYGNLSLKVIDRLKCLSEIPKNYMVVGQHVMFLDHHLNACIDLVEKGYYKGLEIGDHVYAGFSGHAYCNLSFIAGRHLSKTMKAFEVYSRSFVEINQGTQGLFQEIYQETIDKLIEEKNEPYMLEGVHFSEADHLETMLLSNHRTALFVFYFCKMYLAFIYRDFHKAFEYCLAFEAYLDGGTGLIYGLIFYQYKALIRIKLYASQSPDEKMKFKADIKACLSQLAPYKDKINFNHRYQVVQAGFDHLEGRDDLARRGYEAAIQAVIEARYTNDEAVYRELFSDYYLEIMNMEMYHYYRNTAYLAYGKWGAKAKAERMKASLENIGAYKMSQSLYTVHTSHTTYKNHGHLDMHSILKFSQIVAKEMNLSELLSKSLYILIENAGATEGTIVCKNKNKQWIMAKADNKNAFDIRVLQHLELTNDLPHKVINYVQNSRKIVRLDEATKDSLFEKDTYIKDRHVQSLLSYPLMNQGEILGLVVLENTLAQGVFSSERTEFLTLLSTQIAISIENASIYSYLEHIVEERTADLKQKNYELNLLNDKLNHISITDGLTGLNNRRKLDEVLAYEFEKYNRYNEYFSVILMDIDRFKLVNDKYGHLIGDRVLKSVADVLSDITRQVDIVGRWGGEEFLVICPNTDKASACKVAEKIRAGIEDLAIADVGSITCSLGVAALEDKQEIRDLLRCVDERLYASKASGRNKVTC